MAVGDTITPFDVSPVRTKLPAPGLAVLVSATRSKTGAAFATGDEIRLCLGQKDISSTTIKVSAVICNVSSCMLTVPLEDLPKELEASDAAAGLRAIAPSEHCAD